MEVKPQSPELDMLSDNKDSGYAYRERRQNDWKENYTLYRDKVTINRLTQRQSVNLPLMKVSLQTNLKDIDDMPVVYFENLDNDKQAEVFKNEYWKYTGILNNFEIQDIVDKKQEWLYGRSFDQWQIKDGKVVMNVQDPEDILIDRYANPYDLHSSRFLIHTHIFVPMSVIEQNPDYDKKAIANLKLWQMSNDGLIAIKDNAEMLTEKNQKMLDMGLSDVNEPTLGETIVELSMHFCYHKEGKEDEQLYLYVEADGQQILLKKRLEELIGTTSDHYFRNHYPYVTWAGDVDKQDFWSDGRGDIVRTPNKVINSWFSQLTENRTLRNFGMNFYDATKEGFNPQTYEPVPGGWYPLPGKPSDVYQKVDIPDLSESLDEMQFVITMVEKATSASATQQGAMTANQRTLGEVQMALTQAQQRSKSYSKFYTQAWKDRGTMFVKLIEAASSKLDAVKINKKGRNTSEIFTREISPKDWMTKSGYNVKVWSLDEKNDEDTKKLEKLMNAVMIMPGNSKLIEIQQRKALEFAGLTPDEINEVMELEEQKRQQMINTQQVTGPQGITGQPGQPPTPIAPKPPTPQPGMPINNLAKPPMAQPMATARR